MGSPAHNPGTWSTGEPALDAGGLTSCIVRPWSIQLRDANWASGHAGICLMADVLTASGGQLVAESGPTLTAQFDRPERAVNAARRLQRALYAFAESPDAAGFAASIVIHKPEDQVRTRPALAVDELLWPDFAAPGQILVSGSAHEILQFVPGLQFRPVPLEDGSSSPVYQELLWIDPGALDAWRALVVAASQVVRPTDQARRSDVGVAEVEALAEDSPVETLEDQYGDEFEASISSSDSPGKQKRLLIAGGMMLLALVAVLGLVLHMKSKISDRANVPQEPKIPIAVQPTARGQESANPSTSSEKQRALTEKAKPEPAELPTPANPHRATREAETGVAGYEGFTVKQVPQLVRKAEKDAGAGNYDSAKREYEIVLKLQPGNTAAKEGLRKLSLKISERR
jgi:hypothetical protein